MLLFKYPNLNIAKLLKRETSKSKVKTTSLRDILSSLEIPCSILRIAPSHLRGHVPRSRQEKHRADPCEPALRQRAALLNDLHEVTVHAEPHL